MDLNLYLGPARSARPESSDLGSDLALGSLPASDGMSSPPSPSDPSPSDPPIVPGWPVEETEPSPPLGFRRLRRHERYSPPPRSPPPPPSWVTEYLQRDGDQFRLLRRRFRTTLPTRPGPELLTLEMTAAAAAAASSHKVPEVPEEEDKEETTMAMAMAGFATSINVVVLVTMMTSLACVAWGDMAKDREECTEQLVGMATCLPYVQGNARAPTPDCCAGLKAVLSKSPKCLCVLVKDRDDPNLGLKINLTLALHLPAVCSTTANISECPRLLKLPPGSPDAEVFKQPAKAADANATAGAKGDLTEAKESSGGRSRRSTWSEVEMVGGMLLLMLMPLVVLTG